VSDGFFCPGVWRGRPFLNAARGLMHQSSKLLLCRILGNDLPPRHHQRQTLNNVKFILEHERLTEQFERRWILNRLWDSGAEEKLIDLLKRSNQEFMSIPFNRNLYRQQSLDASGLPRSFDPIKIMNSVTLKRAQVIAFEWIYRRKNLTAIGLNSARNVAIETGLKQARWVLPLDGNTFMRREALLDLLELIRENPDAKYLVLPMVRIFDNSVLLERSLKLENVTEEPQLAFRDDSLDRFDEELRYGNRPKAELLVRLGVPGPWHNWKRASWDRGKERLAQDFGKFAIG